MTSPTPTPSLPAAPVGALPPAEQYDRLEAEYVAIVAGMAGPAAPGEGE